MRFVAAPFLRRPRIRIFDVTVSLLVHVQILQLVFLRYLYFWLILAFFAGLATRFAALSIPVVFMGFIIPEPPLSLYCCLARFPPV